MNKGKKNSTELNLGKAESKLPYEKPAMKAISLFADQVLGSCIKVIVPPAADCNGDSSGSTS